MAEPLLFHADYSGAGEARGTYNNSSANFTVSYIKRKDMKTLYPSGGFNVRGQIGAGREQLGTLSSGGEGEEIVYSVAKLAHKRVAGYVPVGGNDYIAVMRDTLLLWILLALLALALIAGLAFGIRAAVEASTQPETTTAPLGVVDPNAQLGEGELDVPEHIDTAGANIQFTGITEMHFVAGQREQNYNYAKNAQVVVVKKDVADQYATAESLEGLLVAVEDGSAGQEAAQAEGLDTNDVLDQATALMEVDSGTSDACVIDLLMAGAMIGEGTSYPDLVTTVELTTEDYGVGCRKGSDLTDFINEQFVKLYEDGTMMELAEKYGIKDNIVEQK